MKRSQINEITTNSILIQYHIRITEVSHLRTQMELLQILANMIAVQRNGNYAKHSK